MHDPEIWTSDRIRNEFFDYFKNKNHTFISSSSTIPLNDPSLLFANAGMNQFKPIFLGTVEPSSERSKLKRAFNSQKCVRAGGKHDDLDNIGKSPHHHTFFEMLGNWSFGDYFKKESIAQSWEVLTTPDLEAKQYWLDQGIPEDHIVPGNAKDNFWEMGKTGPCGPSSEIFFDRVGHRDASHLVNKDDPDVIEIWNNVFIQFNREADGKLKPLPSMHVDTGLGFERLVSILQHEHSTYDTDLFRPILTKIQHLTGVRPYEGRFALTFVLSDGGIPGSVGCGYVLRHILRRGTLTARNKLGSPIGSVFSSLVPGHVYPEILKNIKEIQDTLNREEYTFSQVLERGEKLFHQIASSVVQQGMTKISGQDRRIAICNNHTTPLALPHYHLQKRQLLTNKIRYHSR
ncbi:alanyl-tRNA synthetase [Mycena maculata]|uniref:alanine--tRNA ligase n=1 Tax=Mycena maculata TaxID=230809 RepID=A0AAD7N3I5_9AGAR|nr:alanyl-tRNA synthetase [Mycena maculata]